MEEFALNTGYNVELLNVANHTPDNPSSPRADDDDTSPDSSSNVHSEPEVVILAGSHGSFPLKEVAEMKTFDDDDDDDDEDIFEASPSQRLLPLCESHGLSRQRRTQSLTALNDGEIGTIAEMEYQDAQQEEFTIEQAIDQIGFGKFQIKISMITGFCWMADAFEIMLLSILAPDLLCRWHLDRWQEALITTVVFVGYLFSSPLWGKFCDKFGRKTGLVCCSSMIMYFGFLSAAVPNYYWLLIMRGMVGFGIGGASQTVTLYSEFLPSKVRGFCIVFLEVFWVLGAVFEVLLGLVVMPTLGFRYLLLFSAIPLLIFVILAQFLPESAYYYVACGDSNKAMAILQRVADGNGKPMPKGRIKIDEVATQRGQFADLFMTRQMTITTGLLLFIWFVNAFSYYGIVLLSTELFSRNDGCHGDSSTNQSLDVEGSCFDSCVTLNASDYWSVLITTFAEFPGIVITLLVIEFLGRKKTMALQFFICSIFILLLNLCISRTGLTVLLFGARALISGGFQALYVYTPEVYPTHIRAIGLGSCSSAARVGAIITPFVAQVFLAKSPAVTFGIYGGSVILCAVACLLLPIETKGRELITSVKQMKGECSPRN